ncbi:PREDICTED: uncharacterized protein LOC108562065 [Nicrophorus vespilloides]|uniref:Uncharacterized protein LOC108562065 n=1 Tax=Nicrophorus vespilloides TaxID=110193 RepID=A0ABM1MMF8_NICVS|nr:PREDICTED: uncharacterized protein LOC108562065 [Nicrophorus vespilloides]
MKCISDVRYLTSFNEDCKDTSIVQKRKMKSFIVVFTASLVACVLGGVSVPSGSYIPTSGHKTHDVYQGSGTYPTYGTGIYNAQGLGSLQTPPINYGGVYHGSDYNHMTYGSGEKQVYYFDAPHDFEATKLRVLVQPSGHSEEKVIFIKAPVYRAPEITFHQPAPQPAQRTRVYVLVKKPEEHQEIVVPAAPRSAPLRPDVVFVNYRNQHEAEQQIRNIQGGASSSSGVLAKSVGSHSDLVSSINDYGSRSDHLSINGGILGNIGYSGNTGYSGNVGYSGNEGYTGHTGYTGNHGYTGNGYSGNIAKTGYYGKQVNTHYGPVGSSGPY